jgi:predicted PurR-regulated permease PerM
MDDFKKIFIFLALISAALLVGFIIIKLSGVLTPFLIACFLAYLFNPLVNKLNFITIKKRHLPRTAGVLVVFLLLILLIGVMILALTPILVTQLSLLLDNMMHWLNIVEQDWLPWLAQRFDLNLAEFNINKSKSFLVDHGKQISATMGSLSAILFQSGMGVIKAIFQLSLIFVVLFYLLRDWPRLMQKGQSLLLTYPFGQKIQKTLQNCDAVLSVFFRGQLSVMVALAVIYAFGLFLVGVNYAILLGFISGMLSIVPYLGGVVGLSLSLLAGYIQFHDWHMLLLILGVFGVGQSLESMVLTPYLVGDKLGLHPVAVIFAIMAGGELFGFFGVLLALPVAAVMLVLLKDGHQPRSNRDHDVGSTAF